MNNRLIAKLAIAVSLLVLSFGPANAKAADGFLVISAAAIHFDNFSERNAFVPGLGWEYSPSKKVGFHAGTLSDSFGYQAYYAGFNYGTRRVFNNRVRLLLGASVVHKQFHKNADPETKIIPFPVLEVALTRRAMLNISGSPEIDYQGSHSNAVMFFQFKYNLR